MDEHLDQRLARIEAKIDNISEKLYNNHDRVAKLETAVQGWIKFVLFFAAPVAVAIVVSIIRLYTGGK
jgi:hypothetical protein